jgi:hypothetical protein
MSTSTVGFQDVHASSTPVASVEEIQTTLSCNTQEQCACKPLQCNICQHVHTGSRMYYHFMYAHAFGSGRDTTSMCTLVCLWLQRVAALLPTKAPNVCYDAGSCHQEHSTCSTQSVLRPHPYGLHPACSRSQAAETGATVLCQHQARTPRSFSLFSQQIPQTNHPSCSRSQAAVTAATVPCQHQARTPRSFSLFHQQYLKPTTHRETERVSVFFEIKISNPPSSSSTEQRQSC